MAYAAIGREALAILNAAHVLFGDTMEEVRLVGVMNDACMGKYGEMSGCAFYVAMQELKSGSLSRYQLRLSDAP